MTYGPSTVFNWKAAVDQTYIPKSVNISNSFVGIDDSQLYPLSVCQAVPTGIYLRWEFDFRI